MMQTKVGTLKCLVLNEDANTLAASGTWGGEREVVMGIL